MADPSSIVHVYGEFVRRPYFVIVHNRPRLGHERFDQYNFPKLTDLMLSVVEHLITGCPDLLQRMCELDAKDMTRIAGRTRRYIARQQEELYAEANQYLLPASVEYKGYWFNTNARHTQTRQVIELGCKACEVPYSSVRKLKAFTHDA